MFRSVLRATAVGGGAAAAAAPSQAHAWTQPQQTTGQHAPVRQIVKPDGSVLARLGQDASSEDTIQDWLLTSLEQDEVVFGPEEVADGIDGMLQALGPHLPNAQQLLSDDETESLRGLDSEASSAKAHMAAAGQSMALAHQRDFLTSALSDMLKNPEVQRACLVSLRDNPHFADLVHASTEESMNTSRVVIKEEGEPLLGAGAGPSGVTAGPPGVHLAQLLRQALAHLEAKANAARGALQRLFLRAGLALHRVLGRPFKPEAGAGGAEVERFSKEWWGEVLTVLGCAVVTLLVMQRVGLLAGVAAGGAAYTVSTSPRGSPQGTEAGSEHGEAPKEDSWQQTSA